MTPLAQAIQNEIRLSGPMTLGRYMSLCLAHYYGARDPLGAAGDFTTAPEVSQLFGEMIGAWVADTWMRLGSPSQFLLVEAGPGRGTLMSDILRATKKVQGFHGACAIHLIEMSDALKEKQRVMLKDYAVQWHESIDTLPDDAPILFVANEFLDALPIEQLQFDGGKWMQRVVGMTENNSLQLGLKIPDAHLLSSVSGLTKTPQNGDVLEISPAIKGFVRQLGERMQKQLGAGLFIDYGYDKTAFGDTLQAVKAHKSVSIFDEPGECDLTAHVNFERVGMQLNSLGLHASRVVTQSAFLKTLGIETRLAMLLDHADAQQRKDLISGYERLTDEKQMGTLFKVMGFSSKPLELSGF